MRSEALEPVASTVAMKELNSIFKKLREYLKHSLEWQQVEELYEQAEQGEASMTGDASTTAVVENDNRISCTENAMAILRLPLVEKALQRDEVIFILLELCSTIRELHDDARESYLHTFHNWDAVSKVMSPEMYLGFIYLLAGLPQLKLERLPSSCYRLAIISVDAYLLSLTISGATVYHIFEENIFMHCMQIFKVVGQLCSTDKSALPLPEHKKTELWVQFSTLCDDLKLVLRNVHFKDHLKARDVIIEKCIDVQYFNHNKGYSSLCK